MKLVETRHGYVVRAKRGSGVLVALEWALRAVGAGLVLLGAAMWVFPADWAISQNLGVQIAASLFLAIGGGVLSWKAAHGLVPELQIIPRERRIELVTRNSFGRRRSGRSFALRDLESFYVKRSKDPFTPAGLYLRLRGAHELHVLRGTAAELSALHEILCADLQPVKARQIQRRPRDMARPAPLVA